MVQSDLIQITVLIKKVIKSHFTETVFSIISERVTYITFSNKFNVNFCLGVCFSFTAQSAKRAKPKWQELQAPTAHTPPTVQDTRVVVSITHVHVFYLDLEIELSNFQ